MVHGGMDLKEALSAIKNDLLFWTREVYERVSKSAKQPAAKGKGKTKQASKAIAPPWQPQWTKPRKGDTAPQGKGKGNASQKGKAPKGNTKGKPDWPTHWAQEYPILQGPPPVQELWGPVWPFPQLPCPCGWLDL